MVAFGDLQLCYDARILSEYKEVLLRPKFSFSATDVHNLLAQIEACGFAVAATPLTNCLPDPNDEPFLEVALAGKTRCLVTGNPKHYPVRRRQGMLVVPPTEFLEIYRGKT
jgi:predicted nucleic acid-binding protein